MKNEIGVPLMVGAIVVIVLLVALIGWKMFGSNGAAPAVAGSSDAAAREAHFKQHPEDRAMYEHTPPAAPGGGSADTHGTYGRMGNSTGR